MKIIDRRKVAMGGQSNDRSLSAIKKIVWHYTATLDGSIESHERYWKNAHDWDRGGYHFYIDREGNIHQNYDYERITWGVANNNHNTVHMSLEASTADNYTQAQIESRDWLTRKLMKELSIPASGVQGHWEVYNNTSCPGYTKAEMNNFRAQLAYNPNVLGRTIHKVKSGDTLWSLSQKYETSVDELKKVNGLDSNLIVIGEDLVVNGSKPVAVVPKPILKDLDVIAKEVIDGKWGNYPKRQADLEQAGYNYHDVQATVDRLLSPKLKLLETVVREVIEGKWGNGETRNNKLKQAGYDAAEAQAAVNRALTDNKSKKTYVGLSAAASSWRIYPLGKTPVAGNEKGFLNPKAFGGLTYEVLGYEDNGTTAVIQTADFGKGKIYLDSDATIYKK